MLEPKLGPELAENEALASGELDSVITVRDITDFIPAPTGTIVRHGPRDQRLVALTFDACPTPHVTHGYDERITRILIEKGVSATVFLSGKWIDDHPEETRELAALPQIELGNHSFMHPRMTRIPSDRAWQELMYTQMRLYELTGRPATLFRPPYGEVDHRIAELAARAGMVTIQYDLPAGDSDRRASKAKLIEYISTMTRNGSIVIMHINGRGHNTADALPAIIERLRRRGFKFVTVSELLNASGAQDSPAG